ncbi:hypothetical protein BGZ83_004813 [Gryganskiella cystojenkinii]|nr:hypothetical protein BGZ83_004813 [Gryganskiella cystojenkinii]
MDQQQQQQQQQQRVFSLHNVAQQAQTSNVDASMQHQLHKLRAIVESRGDERSLVEAIHSMAEAQKTFQGYQFKTNDILNTLATRSTRAPPAPLRDPFRGDSEGPTHIEYMSQIKTAFHRYPDAFRNDRDKVNYAFASLKGPAAEFFAFIVASQVPDAEGCLATFDSFAVKDRQADLIIV